MFQKPDYRSYAVFTGVGWLLSSPLRMAIPSSISLVKSLNVQAVRIAVTVVFVSIIIALGPAAAQIDNPIAAKLIFNSQHQFLENAEFIPTIFLIGVAVLVVLLGAFAGWAWLLRRGVSAATAERQDRDDRLSGITISMVDGLIVIEENGIMETVNPAAGRIFGYDAEELAGRPVNMLMNDQDATNHDGYLSRFALTGKGKMIGIGPREVRARRKDGTLFPLDLAISEMRVGGARKFVGVVRDISKRKRVEDELRIARDEAEAANQAKSKFLALMSHELRTPLNAIIGFSEILANQSMGPIENGKYREYVNDIHFSGKHLLDLINDILDISNVDAGSADLEEEDIDVVKLANSVLAMMRDQAEANGIELDIIAPDHLPALRADERKLTQILVNLISNAVKFSHSGGKVTLEIEPDPARHMEFRVTDSGIGIAEQDMERALAPFGQVDSDLNRKYEGTGMGLPLTEALVKMHGGTFRLYSVPNVGTTVEIRFPADRIVDKPVPEPSTEDHSDRKATG